VYVDGEYCAQILANSITNCRMSRVWRDPLSGCLSVMPLLLRRSDGWTVSRASGWCTVRASGRGCYSCHCERDALCPYGLYPLLLAPVPLAAHPLFYGAQQFHSHPMDPIQCREYAAGAWLGRCLGQLACPNKPVTAKMPQL